MAEEIKKAEAEVAAEEAPKKKRASKKAVKEEVKEEAPITRAPIIKDFSIIKHIIVTEETQRLREEENALVFAVDKKADKLEIKAAVQAIFQSKVKSVNTMNLMPKTRRVGRYSGKLPAYKKAIVRFDSSFDLAKVTDAVATEERKANAESDEK